MDCTGKATAERSGSAQDSPYRPSRHSHASWLSTSSGRPVHQRSNGLAARAYGPFLRLSWVTQETHGGYPLRSCGPPATVPSVPCRTWLSTMPPVAITAASGERADDTETGLPPHALATAARRMTGRREPVAFARAPTSPVATVALHAHRPTEAVSRCERCSVH